MPIRSIYSGTAGVEEPSLAELSADRLCPFCGTLNAGFDSQTPCSRCLISDTPVSRSAAHARIGPWFVLHSRNPSAPGMSYQAMIGLIRRGQVKARSVVRGPTTHQLWQFVSSVRGLSREFGVCYDCGQATETNAHVCGNCRKVQDASSNPDAFLDTFDSGDTENLESDDNATRLPKSDTLTMQHLATAFSVQYAPGKRCCGPIARALIALAALVLLMGIALVVWCYVSPSFYESAWTWTANQIARL